MIQRSSRTLFWPGLSGFFATFLLFVPTFAQQSIIGRVTNRNTGSSIAAASIRLESNDRVISITASTDQDGQFRLTRIPAGDYTLSVSAPNFYPVAVRLTLAPRAVQPLEFELDPVTLLKEEMEVMATPLLLDETQGASIASIDPRFVERLAHARRTNMPDLVSAFVPSAVAGHDNLVHLRGNELSLNTSINGVSFLDNPHQYFTPGLNPDVIRSFTVITGGFPAEYGSRFGGILDVVTRSGFDEERHGAVSLGVSTALRHTAAIEYSGHTKRVGYLLYGSGFESQRYLNPPEPEAFHDLGKGSRAFAQFDYRASQTDVLRLVFFGGGSNFQIPNTADEQRRRRDFFQRNREQTAIFTWDHAFSAESLLVTSAYGRLVSSRLLPTNDPVSLQATGVRHTLTTGLRSDYTHLIGTRHVLKGGLEVMLLRLREDFAFDPRENEFEIEHFAFRGRETGGQVSLYLQDRVRLFGNLTANVGLRYDHYSLVTSEGRVSPRVNLAYSIPQSQTVIHFAYNRFFAPPPVENLLLSRHLGVGPPAPAKSNHYEVGVSQALGTRLLVRLTTFLRDDRNSFETTELANVRHFLPTTFARGRAYGAEASVAMPEIPHLGLSGYFTYTAQRAFQIGPVTGGFAHESVEPGERFPAAFDQIHTGTAGVLWRHRRSGLWLGVSFEYGSGTPAELPIESHPEDNPPEHETTLVRLAQHLVVNFSTGIDLFSRERRRISLQFNVENLTDRVYGIGKESAFTPVQFSSPRFYSASLKLRF